MRNISESTMLSIPSLLESMKYLLHLTTSLGSRRIQPKIEQIETGCSLYLPVRDQKKATPWCSAQLKQRNSTISPSTRGRDVAKELTARMNITREFTITFSLRPSLSRFETQNWLDDQKCIETDNFAHEDDSYCPSK